MIECVGILQDHHIILFFFLIFFQIVIIIFFYFFQKVDKFGIIKHKTCSRVLFLLIKNVNKLNHLSFFLEWIILYHFELTGHFENEILIGNQNKEKDLLACIPTLRWLYSTHYKNWESCMLKYCQFSKIYLEKIALSCM